MPCSRLLRTLLGFTLALWPALTMAQQPSAPAAAPRATSTPYSGDLSIFETPGREQRLQIDRVMTLLGIQPGRAVADIGAGSGWFTVRAARRVAPQGTVYAEDINAAAVAHIRERTVQEHLADVQVIEGTPDDPRLPLASVDAVLLLKVYHEIAQPAAFIAHLRPALRPGAKIGIIDRNGNGADHGLKESIVVQEMEAAGFHLSGRYTFTKADGQDYFLIFTAR